MGVLMRLSLRTDYAFRVLIHLAANPDTRVTIRAISTLHRISHNHLMKVVHHLCLCGLVTGTRGRTGGIHLAMSPGHIMVGHVIRVMETQGEFMAGHAPSGNSRFLAADARPLCHLTARAMDAFMAVLEDMSIQDLVGSPELVRSVCAAGAA
ncbi:Rrf2 family transcriptional regulator [Komagataeibacter rhaeticus]|nr:Rrf2 family transcriptional regulator [Komagataeibacter rhaeticus]GBQ09121.1 Rrf2 family transcriptional regulator [Komagataeibacter rhaeticus DSM 16663]